MSAALASPPERAIRPELDRINEAFLRLHDALRATEQERDALRAEVAALKAERDQYRKAVAAWSMNMESKEELERRAKGPSKPLSEVMAKLELLANDKR